MRGLGVTYVPAQVLPMSPVYTQNVSRLQLSSEVGEGFQRFRSSNVSTILTTQPSPLVGEGAQRADEG